MTQAIRIDIQNQVATVTLSRPEVRNAFNDEVIAELSHAFSQLGEDPAVRGAVEDHVGHALDSAVDVFAGLRHWKDGFRG